MTARSTPQDGYHPWTTYMWASEEARRRGDRTVGTDHLLLGLLEDPEIEGVLGVRLDEARHALDKMDREALRFLGMDATVDAPPLPMRTVPRRPTIRAVVHDRLRMTPMAKTVLQESGKPMRRGKHITSRQVLLRLLDLEPPDPAATLLATLDVEVDEVRLRIA